MDVPVRPPRPRKPTRAAEVRLQLADEIVNGVLAPGATLDETDLAHRFGVSRTPVREALRALAASGLVETRPHRGTIVAHPASQRLAEMFLAMAELEALCAGLAAIAMNAAERRELEALHAALGALVREGDPERYHELNEAFHGAIYAGAHNGYLADLTAETRVRVQPYRRAQFRQAGRLARSYAEHDLIVAAILRGDRTVAAQAMRDHIVIVRDAYDQYLGGL